MCRPQPCRCFRLLLGLDVVLTQAVRFLQSVRWIGCVADHVGARDPLVLRCLWCSPEPEKLQEARNDQGRKTESSNSISPLATGTTARSARGRGASKKLEIARGIRLLSRGTVTGCIKHSTYTSVEHQPGCTQTTRIPLVSLLVPVASVLPPLLCTREPPTEIPVVRSVRRHGRRRAAIPSGSEVKFEAWDLQLAQPQAAESLTARPERAACRNPCRLLLEGPRIAPT